MIIQVLLISIAILYNIIMEKDCKPVFTTDKFAENFVLFSFYLTSQDIEKDLSKQA